MKTALTIAGSDCSGGAGIQADLKTMTVHGVYGMSVITALTAQNTTGISAIYKVTEEFLKQQMDSIFTDIVPDAVKIGMVVSASFAEIIAERLCYYQANNIVFDPVLSSTSKTMLFEQDGIETLEKRLFPIARLITPNLLEAERFVNRKLNTKKKIEEAAIEMGKRFGCSVLLKGGHSTNNIKQANDFLYEFDTDRKIWINGVRYLASNTHGTGCTLSSAIVSNLAKGIGLEESVRLAKAYLNGAFQNEIYLGKGNGPLNHIYMEVEK